MRFDVDPHRSTISLADRSDICARVLLHRNIPATVEDLLGYCAKRLRPSALTDSITLEKQAGAALN